MYSGSKHLACTIIYLVVISWKGTILANGNDQTTGDTTVDKLTINSVNLRELLTIPNGVLNGTKANSVSSTATIILNNSNITIYNLICVDHLNANVSENKKALNNIRNDYTRIQDIGIYKLQKRKLSWYGAYRACMEQNAHLVVINSLREADVLGQLMMAHEDIRSAYIGANDIFREGEWTTIHGESLENAAFNVWAPGEPNDADGNEDCAVLRSNGTMNDIPCSFEWYYICEMRL